MKPCKKELSTIVNCDVLKLVSITFSKMLFIISSLFLPHPVHAEVLQESILLCVLLITF